MNVTPTLDIRHDTDGRIAAVRPALRSIPVASLSRPGHTYQMRWIDCLGWQHTEGDLCRAAQVGHHCRHRRIAQELWLAPAPTSKPLDLDREFAALELEAAYAADRGDD